MDTIAILDGLEADRQKKQKTAWGDYRQLLEKARLNGNKLAPKDQITFNALVEALGLDGEAVRAHLAALDLRQRTIDAIARREILLKEMADLQPQIDEYVARRATIISELDAEGLPLFDRHATLQRSITSIDISSPNPAAIENEHNELFSIEVIPPAPRIEKTERECIAEQTNLAESSTALSLIAMLRNFGSDFDPQKWANSQLTAHRELLLKYGPTLGLRADALEALKKVRRELPKMNSQDYSDAQHLHACLRDVEINFDAREWVNGLPEDSVRIYLAWGAKFGAREDVMTALKDQWEAKQDAEAAQ